MNTNREFQQWVAQAAEEADRAAANLEIMVASVRKLAEEAISRYQAEIAHGRLQAIHALTQTILPWWQELQPVLPQLERTKNFLVHHPVKVSGNFRHFYPRKARTWSLTRQHFEMLAELGLGTSPANLVDINEEWNGFFGIRQRGGQFHLVVGYQPLTGGGYAFSLMAPQLEVELSSDVDLFLDQVHPEVILGFAKEIGSGKVWDTLRLAK